MKNIVKVMSVALIAISFSACQGNGEGNRGTMDSTVTRNAHDSTTTTVDTLSHTDEDSVASK